jgi:hypothetical protein
MDDEGGGGRFDDSSFISKRTSRAEGVHARPAARKEISKTMEGKMDGIRAYNRSLFRNENIVRELIAIDNVVDGDYSINNTSVGRTDAGVKETRNAPLSSSSFTSNTSNQGTSGSKVGGSSPSSASRSCSVFCSSIESGGGGKGRDS